MVKGLMMMMVMMMVVMVVVNMMMMTTTTKAVTSSIVSAMYKVTLERHGVFQVCMHVSRRCLKVPADKQSVIFPPKCF